MICPGFFVMTRRLCLGLVGYNYFSFIESESPMNCKLSCTSSKLQLIAHPLRLKILCQLDKHELTVQQIVLKAGSSQSNISQHLGRMREKGILESRRDANRVYYRIGDVELLGIIQKMRDIYCSNDA